MALTVVRDRRTVWGDRRVTFLNVTFDASYPTGGESLTPAMAGLTEFDAVVQHGVSTHSVVHSGTTNLLLVYLVSTAAEVADTTDLSALTVQLICIGK